jgi:uncharacterized membrane protein
MGKREKSGGVRLAFLDWTRGLAAVIMLQGHAFHSFSRQELRDSGPYMFSQFLGGMPPAIFLFLVGVTLSFLMDSRERQGLSSGRRVWAALRRAGYLFGIAMLFRIQLWLFARPYSPWTDLLRVDILNAMGLAVAVMSVMAVFQTADRVRLGAALGVVIAAASPLISQLDWSGVHPAIRSYITPDALSFGFFPWAAFVAFGLSAGSVIRLLRPDQLERAVQWAALLGFGLVLGGQYFANLPYSVYAKSEFWLNSPWQILIKLGVILLVLAFAFVWSKQAAAGKWSWIRQFGTTSLLVYWVHIELIYGRSLWFWKENLSTGETTLAALALIVLMLLLSVARTQWKNRQAWSPAPGWAWLLARKAPEN